MAGKDNLRPVHTKEEARERGRNGGIKSGQSRRRKKTFAETVDRLLNEPVKDPKQLEVIQKSGLPVRTKPTYKDFFVASVIMRSIKKGSVDDLMKMMEILGEEPMQSDTDTLKRAKEILGDIDSAID